MWETPGTGRSPKCNFVSQQLVEEHIVTPVLVILVRFQKLQLITAGNVGSRFFIIDFRCSEEGRETVRGKGERNIVSCPTY